MQKKIIEDFGKRFNKGEDTPNILMSLNNNNISCINGVDQFDNEYDDDEEIKDF